MHGNFTAILHTYVYALALSKGILCYVLLTLYLTSLLLEATAYITLLQLYITRILLCNNK